MAAPAELNILCRDADMIEDIKFINDNKDNKAVGSITLIRLFRPAACFL